MGTSWIWQPRDRMDGRWASSGSYSLVRGSVDANVHVARVENSELTVNDERFVYVSYNFGQSGGARLPGAQRLGVERSAYVSMASLLPEKSWIPGMMVAMAEAIAAGEITGVTTRGLSVRLRNNIDRLIHLLKSPLPKLFYSDGPSTFELVPTHDGSEIKLWAWRDAKGELSGGVSLVRTTSVWRAVISLPTAPASSKRFDAYDGLNETLGLLEATLRSLAGVYNVKPDDKEPEVQTVSNEVGKSSFNLVTSGLEMGAVSAAVEKTAVEMLRRTGGDPTNPIAIHTMKMAIVLGIRHIVLPTMGDNLPKRDFVEKRVELAVQGVSATASYEATSAFMEVLGPLVATFTQEAPGLLSLLSSAEDKAPAKEKEKAKAR